PVDGHRRPEPLGQFPARDHVHGTDRMDRSPARRRPEDRSAVTFSVTQPGGTVAHNEAARAFGPGAGPDGGGPDGGGPDDGEPDDGKAARWRTSSVTLSWRSSTSPKRAWQAMPITSGSPVPGSERGTAGWSSRRSPMSCSIVNPASSSCGPGRRRSPAARSPSYSALPAVGSPSRSMRTYST